ncbi:MAG: phosphatidylserine decarboxylase [Acidobacteriota bacterium]
MPFAREAFSFALPPLVLGLLALYFGFPWVAIPLVVLAGFVVFFFRDPERKIPDEADCILSPADGKIVRIRKEAGGTRVSIFLSIFDVHVNRAPVDGRIEHSEHREGRFLFAFDDRASVENEQHSFRIGDISFSLIAGLVARRIVPWKAQGDYVQRGDRIALIRFGSRVDLLVPADGEIAVAEGDRVRAGTSILARRRGLQ